MLNTLNFILALVFEKCNIVMHRINCQFINLSRRVYLKTLSENGLQIITLLKVHTEAMCVLERFLYAIHQD